MALRKDIPNGVTAEAHGLFDVSVRESHLVHAGRSRHGWPILFAERGQFPESTNACTGWVGSVEVIRIDATYVAIEPLGMPAASSPPKQEQLANTSDIGVATHTSVAPCWRRAFTTRLVT